MCGLRGVRGVSGPDPQRVQAWPCVPGPGPLPPGVDAVRGRQLGCADRRAVGSRRLFGGETEPRYSLATKAETHHRSVF